MAGRRELLIYSSAVIVIIYALWVVGSNSLQTNPNVKRKVTPAEYSAAWQKRRLAEIDENKIAYEALVAERRRKRKFMAEKERELEAVYFDQDNPYVPPVKPEYEKPEMSKFEGIDIKEGYTMFQKVDGEEAEPEKEKEE